MATSTKGSSAKAKSTTTRRTRRTGRRDPLAISLLKADHREVEDDLLDEAYVEHDGAKKLIAEIEGMKPSDEYYDAKVKVLGEYIKHHVKEEEQPGGLFAQAKKGDEDLDAMGQRLKARKEELMKEMGGEPTH